MGLFYFILFYFILFIYFIYFISLGIGQVTLEQCSRNVAKQWNSKQNCSYRRSAIASQVARPLLARPLRPPHLEMRVIAGRGTRWTLPVVSE
jgi:hypothetical protein